MNTERTAPSQSNGENPGLVSKRVANKRNEISTDLVDNLEIFAPLQFSPEWPYIDPAGRSELIEAESQRIDGKYTDREADFLRAQYRAIDYLYGRREEAVDGKAPNPLVDVVALISNIGDLKLTGSTLQLAIEGKPEPDGWITNTSKEKKTEQRTFQKTKTGKKEYRTLARFSEQLTTVIRGLYVLGEASKHHPLITRATVNEYAKSFADGKNSVAGSAIGLLEILHNLDLKYDPRFSSFAEQLRDVVLEEVVDYPSLAKNYSYCVVEDRHFWYQGEISDIARKRLSYVKSKDVQKIETKRHIEFDLPEIKNWQNTAKRRANIVDEIRGLTLFGSIKATAVNFSEEKAIEKVISDRVKKADFQEQKRIIEKKDTETLLRTWRGFLETEIDEGSTISKDEEELMVGSIKAILGHFRPDETLSQKAKTNIAAVGEGNGLVGYKIDVTRLGNDPLFSWVLALRNPYIRDGFREAITKSPETTESFYLHLKAMTFLVLKTSLAKKEYDFLFDPNFRTKVNKDSLLGLFDEIVKLTEGYTPDVGEIVKAALSEGDGKIEDLLSEESLRKQKEKLETLTYRTVIEIFGRKVKIDRSYALTEADKKKVKLLLIGAGSTVLLSFLMGNLNTLDSWIDRRVEESLRESTEQARQEEGIRQEAETARQAQALRVSQAMERAQASIQQEVSGESQEAQDAGLVAQMNRIPGEIDDRIPDAIRQEGDALPSESERFGLAGFGRIYHLPESMHVEDGDPVGFFPWDINLYAWGDADIDTSYWYSWYDAMQPFGETHLVDSIDNLEIDFEGNQLAYSLNGVNAEMYPPIGWRTVAVYQEGGREPLIGPLGELYYGYDNMDNFPARAVVVLEPVSLESVNPKVNLFEGAQGPEYFPRVYQSSAEAINVLLAGDPTLQQIHADFIREVQAIREDRLYGRTTEEEARQFSSDVAIRYAGLYADYTAANRYYALGFQIENLTTYPADRYPSLVSLANRPDAGYFCSVASFAFRDFMASAGFVAGNQPGIALYDYQGYLWGGMGHMNNVVFLPDGRVMEVDMQPSVTERTSQEDLDSLGSRVVTSEDIRRAIERANLSVLASTQEAQPQPIDDEDAVRRMVTERERLRRMSSDPEYVSEEEFGRYLDEIYQSAEELFSEEVNARRDLGNVDDITRATEQLELLRSITANTQSIRENPPTLNDIYLESAQPEAILAEYELSQQILEDLDALSAFAEGSSDREVFNSTLDDMTSSAQSLQEAISHAGGERLGQAQEDARLQQRLEDTYRGYYETSGHFPWEETDETLAYNSIEIERARRYFEDHRQITPEELAYYDEVFMERLIGDAQQFIEGTTGQENQESLGEGNSDTTVSIDTLATEAGTLANHIRNTQDIYRRLGRGDRATLENLSALTSELEELMRDGTVSVTEERLERAREIRSDLERLDRRVEKIRGVSHPNENSEERNAEVNRVVNEILGLSGKMCVGLTPLALAYLGLRTYKGIRRDKEIAQKIEESLQAQKKLSKTEKSIILSTVGHLAHLTYDAEFPQRATALLNLLQHYVPGVHERAINWLTNEGAELLFTQSPQDSYVDLAELVNGKARGDSKNEIYRSFPTSVTKELKKIPANNGRGKEPKAEPEVPFDFMVIYGISRLLFNNSITSLHDEVMRRLGRTNGRKEKSLPYKVTDVLEVLRSKYVSSNTPEEIKPIFNSVYFLLNWASQSDRKPILSD